MSVLPVQLQYVPVLPSLSDATVNTSVVVQPSNGSVFSENAIVQFDLASRPNSFLDPSTLYIRYRLTLTSAASAEIKGAIPAMTPFSALQVTFGSQIVETVQQFGVVSSMLCNLTHNASQKAGMAYGYGLDNPSATTMGANLNGRLCALNEVITMSAPLRCILSESERLVPLGLMPLVRVSLTCDTISNIFSTTVVPTGYAITNMELCYDSIDFGSNVNAMVASMGEKIYIKSSSCATSSATLASGTSGTISLLYNTRLSSVKSLITNFGGTVATSLNKLYDSFDVTSQTAGVGLGSYQYLIAGIPYPARAVSTANNRAGALSELRLAIGGFGEGTTDISITPQEFGYANDGTTTFRIPSKFYFGSNTQKLQTNGVLLSGVSTQSSPISLIIECPTATDSAFNVMLVAIYDALIEITPSMKDATVKQ